MKRKNIVKCFILSYLVLPGIKVKFEKTHYVFDLNLKNVKDFNCGRPGHWTCLTLDTSNVELWVYICLTLTVCINFTTPTEHGCTQQIFGRGKI